MASQLASCSYQKIGSQDHRIANRIRHEKQLDFASGGGDWRVCGKLELSSKYKMQTAAGVQHSELQYYSENMAVTLSPETGIVKCSCHMQDHQQHPVSPPSVDLTNHQVAIVVQVVDRENHNHFKISLPLEPIACQVSYCRKNPTNLLTIERRRTVSEHISLQLSSECTGPRAPQINVQLLENGMVELSKSAIAPFSWTHRLLGQTTDNSDILLQNRHGLSQKCCINVTHSIKLANHTDSPYARHEINFTQLLPLELTTCVNLLREHHVTLSNYEPSVVLLSVKPWLNDHDTGHNSPGSYHAEPSTASDTIHEKGGHIVSKFATRHGAPASNVHRRVRQVTTSPPEFNDTFYMGSVVENSPLGTFVITVRAMGNGPINYVMTADSGFSRGLFAINRTTGVVTTTGLSGFFPVIIIQYYNSMNVCVCVCVCVRNPVTDYWIQCKQDNKLIFSVVVATW